MKRTELERKLRSGGWQIGSGGKHNYATHPKKPGVKITVPRGSNINDQTAKGILRDAGII
jgi:predicted RNA binding protein YcfA (HicA-like mRNA interferase family)